MLLLITSIKHFPYNVYLCCWVYVLFLVEIENDFQQPVQLLFCRVRWDIPGVVMAPRAWTCSESLLEIGHVLGLHIQCEL